MNSGTFQEAFGNKFNSAKSRSVYRFPTSGGDGQTSVFAGGYAAQAPSIKAPSSYASNISNLALPTFQAQSTWQNPENVYGTTLSSLTEARIAELRSSGQQGGGTRNGGSWGSGTGRGLGLSAYGYNGKTGTPDLRGTGTAGLQQPFSDALDTMFADMERQGLGRPSITDGFRSYEGQVQAKAKWTKKGKPNMAATPGRSVHGLGLAADLGLTTAQYNWMKRNAARYGILNLPSETWHWQFDPARWVNRGATASRQVLV
jgi:hypothetical protein